MQRIIRSILGSVVPAALLALAPAALAQPMGPAHGGPGGPGGPGEVGRYLGLVHKAGLSDAQQQQVHALLEAQRSSAKAIFDSLRSAHQALDAKLYGQSTPSASDLAAEASRLTELHQQLDAVDFQTILKIRALLTPDQLTTVNGLHDKLESLHQQMDEILGPPEAAGLAAPTRMP